MNEQAVIPVHGDGSAWLRAVAALRAAGWLCEQARDDATDLALIGEHAAVLVSITDTRYEPEWRVIKERPGEGDVRAVRPGDDELRCQCCRTRFPCKTLVIVAGKYAGRPGYAGHWENW